MDEHHAKPASEAGVTYVAPVSDDESTAIAVFVLIKANRENRVTWKRDLQAVAGNCDITIKGLKQDEWKLIRMLCDPNDIKWSLIDIKNNEDGTHEATMTLFWASPDTLVAMAAIDGTTFEWISEYARALGIG